MYCTFIFYILKYNIVVFCTWIIILHLSITISDGNISHSHVIFLRIIDYPVAWNLLMAQGVKQEKLSGKVRDYPFVKTSPRRYSSFNYTRRWREKDTKETRDTVMPLKFYKGNLQQDFNYVFLQKLRNHSCAF